MAEVYIIGQILKAVDFKESHIFCKWSLQSGADWKLLEGESEGQTILSGSSVEETSDFSYPLDIHFAAASVQGWPKFHVEVYAVNALQKSWPIGYGFVHIPTSPGLHRLELLTWSVVPGNWLDKVRESFGDGGVALGKADLIYSGVERYKLQTRTSGKILIDISLIFRNFTKYGVEFQE